MESKRVKIASAPLLVLALTLISLSFTDIPSKTFDTVNAVSVSNGEASSARTFSGPSIIPITRASTAARHRRLRSGLRAGKQVHYSAVHVSRGSEVDRVLTADELENQLATLKDRYARIERDRDADHSEESEVGERRGSDVLPGPDSHYISLFITRNYLNYTQQQRHDSERLLSLWNKQM